VCVSQCVCLRIFVSLCVFVEDAGYHFFVMDFLEGGDLHRAVKSGKFDDKALLEMILAVADALAYAHEQGMIHRDVKPGNILLDSEERAYLTDFDLVLARDTTGGTRTKGGMGSFIYAAPELMANAKKAGAQADIYGLAMTTLFTLFGDDLPMDVMRDAPGFVSDLDINATLKRILKRAVAWNAEERFFSMRVFCDEVRASMQDEPSPEVLVPKPYPPNLGGKIMALEESLPWGKPLLERFTQDGCFLTNVSHTRDRERWFLQIRVPEKTHDEYGTAPEVLILATGRKVHGKDLRAAKGPRRNNLTFSGGNWDIWQGAMRAHSLLCNRRATQSKCPSYP